MTLITIATVLQSVQFIAKLADGEPVVRDGMLTVDFLLFACLVLEFAGGIFSLCVIRREEKEGEGEK